MTKKDKKSSKGAKNTFLYGIEQSAKINPKKPAIIYGDKEFTWEEFDGRVNALAHAFLDIGLKRGERISIALYNCNQFTEVTCAAWKIAAITVPLNYRFMDKELYYVLDNSDTVAVVLDQDFIDIFQRLGPELKKVRYYIVLGNNMPPEWLSYEELIKKYPKNKPELPWKQQSDDDIGYNIYTGGTTGYPKGIAYTEENFIGTLIETISGSIPEILKRLSKAPDSMFKSLPVPVVGSLAATRPVRWILRRDTVAKLIKTILPKMPMSSSLIPRLIGGKLKALFVSPFMHAWAWAIHLAILRVGGTIVIPDNKSYDPDEALKIIEDRKIQVMAAIGDATLKPMVLALDKKKYDTKSLFCVIASGMPTSSDVKKKLLGHMPQLMLLDVFISSELSHGAFTPYTASDKEFEKVTFQTTDNIKIIDPETGKPVKPGEIGEVARRTETLPEGYYKDPEKTKKLIRTIDGAHWLFSGDLARLDERGYFHFVGRGSECINTGGEKVYPEEVEELIKQYPKVENVGITGVPDEKWGEAVTAIVQLKEGEKATPEEIREFCKGKISGYKRPKHVLFVDELPTTLIGKAHYAELRKLAKKMVIGE